MLEEAVAWVWTMPFEDPNITFAEYDYKRSSISSADVTSADEIDFTGRPSVILKLDIDLAKNKHYLHSIPTTILCPLIDRKLCGIIKDFSGELLDIVPVLLETRNSRSRKFSFARPLLEIGCLDLERSIIEDWIIPGEVILDASKLVFKDDCLGNSDYVRDTYTNHVVVSNRLRLALLESKDPNLRFRLPEDVWNIYSQQHLH